MIWTSQLLFEVLSSTVNTNQQELVFCLFVLPCPCHSMRIRAAAHSFVRCLCRGCVRGFFTYIEVTGNLLSTHEFLNIELVSLYLY